MGGLLKSFIGVFLFFICGGVFLDAFAETPEDMKEQLANLERHLEAAENIPGEEGISRARYYTEKINAVRTALKKAGVVAEEEPRHTPWSSHAAFGKKRIKERQHDNPEERNILKRLDAIDHRIKVIHDAITDPTADLASMKDELASLLEEQGTLRERLTTLTEDGIPHWGTRFPGEKEGAINESDALHKGPTYVQHIQEELQRIYDAIYEAHLKTLKTTAGSNLIALGQEIAKLEQQEMSLKRRLKKMGVKPNPPEILSNPHTYKKRKAIHTEGEYLVSLKQHLGVIEQRMRTLNNQVKTAASGHELATLGTHISQLEQQRMLLKKTITANTPVKQQVADYHEQTKAVLAAFPETIPWGQVTTEVMNDFQRNPETYKLKAMPKESLGWGQLSHETGEKLGINENEKAALLQKMVDKERSSLGWGQGVVMPTPLAGTDQDPAKRGLWESVEPLPIKDSGPYYDPSEVRAEASFSGYDDTRKEAMANLWSENAAPSASPLDLTTKAQSLWAN